MNLAYLIGLLVGIVFGLGIVAVLIRFCRKDKRWRSKYDERQKIAMGKAYRDGFWTLIIAGFIIMFIADMGFDKYLSDMILIACLLGLSVYVIECIMRDAYMGITDKPKRWVIVIAAAGLLNIFIAVLPVVTLAGEMSNVNLYVGIFALLMDAAYLVRQAMLKSETAADDDGGNI